MKRYSAPVVITQALVNTRWWAYALSLALLSVSFSAVAEKKQSGAEEKVGLVLSGGGALGFAHVGVLKVLREEHIPVHFVTGTSMGAIVGAALASGRSIEEMEQVLTETNWDRLFSEEEERSRLAFQLKPGKGREIVGKTKIGFSDAKLAVPVGFIEGQHVLPLLQRLYHGVPNPVHFDELAVPFRGVAADIENGSEVVFEEGHLPSVVRASMSVPGLFSPVEYGGRFLVDGGIVNNLPVDVALDLGADRLIVVDLQVPFKARDELGSPLSIAGQMVSLLLQQNTTRQYGNMRKSDVLVTVNLPGYSSADFARGGEIMDIGEAAAREAVAQLRELAIPAAQYAALEQERLNAFDPPTEIEFVRFDNETSIADEEIREVLGIKRGDAFDRSVIEEKLRALYDYGYFSRVTYQLIEENNKAGILVKTEEKAWLDRFVRVGASFEDDFNGDENYRLALSFRQSSPIFQGSYWDVDAEIGRFPRLETELFATLGDGSPYFVAPSGRLGRSDVFVRSGSDIVAEYQRTTGNVGLRAGRILGRSGELGLGFVRGFGDLDRRIGDSALPERGFDIGELSAGLIYDSLDTVDFPTEGALLSLAHRYALEDLGSSDEFNDLRGRVTVPYTFGRNTIGFSGDFGVTFDERPLERSYTIGGFFDLSGVEQNALLASDYAIGRLIGYRRFSEAGSPLLGLEFFLGGTVEYAILKSDIAAIPDDTSIVAGSVFVGLDTPILPAYFGLGLTDDNDFSLYLTLGRIGARVRE